ncbi:hypothetical protein IL306_006133 [Fusarium sp. DS 682]|nr:hypothetical protein IL306_006133 [Fusarium sp. DS 682]
MVSIAALPSTRHSIFAKPHPQRYAAAAVQTQFANPVSDHLSELAAFYKWRHQCKLGEEKQAVWCHETFLNVEALNEVFKVRKDLLDKCCELFRIKSAPILSFDDKEYDIKIRKAIARGFYHYAAIIDDPTKDQYRTLDNFPVGIDPNSALVGMGWKWVVYHKLGYTSYQYMDRCTAVQLDWLLDTSHFYAVNLPKDYNCKVRNKKLRAIFDARGRPDQPPSQQS